MFKLRLCQLILVMTAFFSCAPQGYKAAEMPVSSGLPQSNDKANDSAGPAGFPGTGSGPGSSEVPGSPVAGPEADSSLACLGCHDYTENHHPSGFAPADASKFPFPLYDGRVRCLTCHVEDHMGPPKMLRGGPYAGRREICFKCHYEEEYRYIYPHIMLDGEGRIIEVNGKPLCLVCHSKMPDPRVDRTEDVAFRADVAFLCWRCHSLMGQPVLNEHILMKPLPNMLRYLEQNEQKLNVTIPLVPRDRITCSTCHNPHQKGVITYEPSAKGADAPGRLRLDAQTLCIACHVM